jgi:hypothetical protein
MRIDSCSRFEDALNRRAIPDWLTGSSGFCTIAGWIVYILVEHNKM